MENNFKFQKLVEELCLSNSTYSCLFPFIKEMSVDKYNCLVTNRLKETEVIHQIPKEKEFLFSSFKRKIGIYASLLYYFDSKNPYWESLIRKMWSNNEDPIESLFHSQMLQKFIENYKLSPDKIKEFLNHLQKATELTNTQIIDETRQMIITLSCDYEENNEFIGLVLVSLMIMPFCFQKIDEIGFKIPEKIMKKSRIEYDLVMKYNTIESIISKSRLNNIPELVSNSQISEIYLFLRHLSKANENFKTSNYQNLNYFINKALLRVNYLSLAIAITRAKNIIKMSINSIYFDHKYESELRNVYDEIEKQREILISLQSFDIVKMNEIKEKMEVFEVDVRSIISVIEVQKANIEKSEIIDSITKVFGLGFGIGSFYVFPLPPLLNWRIDLGKDIAYLILTPIKLIWSLFWKKAKFNPAIIGDCEIIREEKAKRDANFLLAEDLDYDEKNIDGVIINY